MPETSGQTMVSQDGGDEEPPLLEVYGLFEPLGPEEIEAADDFGFGAYILETLNETADDFGFGAYILETAYENLNETAGDFGFDEYLPPELLEKIYLNLNEIRNYNMIESEYNIFPIIQMPLANYTPEIEGTENTSAFDPEERWNDNRDEINKLTNPLVVSRLEEASKPDSKNFTTWSSDMNYLNNFYS